MTSDSVIQLVRDLQQKLYPQGLVTTLPQLQDCLTVMSGFLHPNHALMMMAKRFLLQSLSQLPAEKVFFDADILLN
jgi:hypothetical protein